MDGKEIRARNLLQRANPWTKEQDEFLLSELKKGLVVNDIVNTLHIIRPGVTKDAIYARSWRLRGKPARKTQTKSIHTKRYWNSESEQRLKSLIDMGYSDARISKIMKRDGFGSRTIGSIHMKRMRIIPNGQTFTKQLNRSTLVKSKPNGVHTIISVIDPCNPSNSQAWCLEDFSVDQAVRIIKTLTSIK